MSYWASWANDFPHWAVGVSEFVLAACATWRLPRPVRDGVYHGGPTPAGAPPIPRAWTRPDPSTHCERCGVAFIGYTTEKLCDRCKPAGVLSTSGILTPNEQRTMVQAWGSGLVAVLQDGFTYEQVR